MSDVTGSNRQPNGNSGADSLGHERNLTQQATELGRDLKDKASELTDTVTRTAKDQIGELGSAAKDIATDASGKVETAINEQKGAGARYIGSIASAVHRAAGEFDSDVPQAAHYIRQAADQIEGVANAVRDRDLRDLVGEVEQFARRQPTLFFGGALFLGFAAIRFLKSSSPSSNRLPSPSPAPGTMASASGHSGAS